MRTLSEQQQDGTTDGAPTMAETVGLWAAELEDARTAYLGAEQAYTQADNIERPLLGHLSHAEMQGAKLAANKCGRELVADHWPALRFRIGATDDGAHRLMLLRRTLDHAKHRMDRAIVALDRARKMAAAAMTDAEMRRSIASAEAVYEAMDADIHSQAA